MKICWWQDNLQSKDVPPSWMWHLEEELVDWFERLKAERDDDEDEVERDDDDDRPRRRKPDKVVPLERNSLTKGRGRDS